jgi:uncharacterized protein (TIGR03437 family)
MKFHRALCFVAGIATLCASGEIYAQSNSAQTNFVTGQAARLVVGQTTFTTANYGSTNQLLGAPSGIAIVNGVLWVADANRLGALPSNNRVLRFSDIPTYPKPTDNPYVPGSLCSVCRGVASQVLGQPDFVSADTALTGSGMRNPTGIASDGTILAVADTDNNRILIWHSLPRANGQPADTVIGQKDLTHSATSVPPTATSLRGPTGIWMAGGKLYVADTQDNRILIYNQIPAAGNNNVAADVVLGQPNFTSFVQPDLTQATATPAANNMQDPVSVTTDGTRLYVADLGQNRVLIWNHIPTTNNAAADIAVGQPNLTSAISNNSSNSTGDTLDADGNPIGALPVLCPSNGTDITTGTAYFPLRCSATLSFPRFALSDGTRLFIADGGNDRVLVYNSIPTVSGAHADTVLGEPDEFSDNTNENPDGTNTFQSPTALAWDAANLNLYVSDTYNRRILVFSPGVLNVPLQGVVNAASLNIAAIGSVLIQGTIVAKDTITVTIQGTDYKYTVLSTDTLVTVAKGLQKLINTAPDPYVLATVDSDTGTLVLTARQSGPAGANVTLATSISNGAQISPVASGSALSLNLETPTSIAPATLVQISGASLCDNTATASYSGSSVPTNLGGCQVFVDGNAMPLLYVSPTQINAQMPVFFTDRTSVSLYVRTTHADGSVTVTAPVAVTIVLQNPGIFAQFGTDPRPGFVYHYSNVPQDVIQVGGSINAGDVGTITIGSNTYTYTVLSTDTLLSVQEAIINLINAGPDPNVTASFANTNNNIVLTAQPNGIDENGLAVTATVTGTNAVLLLTATNATMCCETAASDTIVLGGTIQAGDVAQVTIAGNTYSYTVLSTDTLTTVQSALIGLINGAPDPNVLVAAASTATTSTNTNIVVVSLLPGTGGNGLPISATVTGNSPMLTLSTEYPTLCCAVQGGTLVTVNNPAKPGEFVYVLATGLGPTYPNDQDSGAIFQGGSANPPQVPVDSILTGSFAATIVSAQLVPGTVGVYEVLLQLSSSATTDALSQTTIAQQTFVSNVVTFAIQQPGYPFSADVLAANGNIKKKLTPAAPPAPRRGAK